MKRDSDDKSGAAENLQTNEMFQNIIKIEVEKLKKEQKDKLKDYENKIQQKNKVINDLLTEQENSKTDQQNL